MWNWIKKLVKNGNTLLGLIIITVVVLYMYGVHLERHGYSNLLVQGPGSKVALAVIGLREGYFPWTDVPGWKGMEADEMASSDPFVQGMEDADCDIEETLDLMDQILEEVLADSEIALSNSQGQSPVEYFLENQEQHAVDEVTQDNEELVVDGSADLSGFGNTSVSDNMTASGGNESGEAESGRVESGNANAGDVADNEEQVRPVMENVSVDDDYFSDAVFIGDSRMVGVEEYAGIDNATFLAKVSMTIYNMMDTKVSLNGKTITVREALEQNQYGKIYVMVGINELGTGNTAYFANAYASVLQEIRELQPDALIIIQAIMHVTGEKNMRDSIFNNTNINSRNEALKEFCNGEDIFYIDVNPVYDDVNGNLREELSADDIHLYGNCYGPWREFLYENGFVR